MSAQLGLGAIMALPPAALDAFEVFWAAYPRHRGTSKQAARLAFVRARRRASVAEIMAGLEAYQFDPEERWQPHASTWLNDRRWVIEAGPDLAADPFGLGAWLARQDGDGGPLFSVQGYDPEALRDILLACGFAPTWRGSLDVLGRWLVDGYRPDSVADVCAEVCVTLVGEARSLATFDRSVRRLALRWSARRMEWVRG